MSRENLKPCPFCGCDYGGLYFVISENKFGFYTLGIFCDSCKQTIVLEENEWEGENEETKARAIEAWNRRVADEAGN